MKQSPLACVPVEDNLEEKEMGGGLFTDDLSFAGAGLSSSTSLTTLLSEVSTALVLYDQTWGNSTERKSVEGPIHSGGSVVESSTSVAGNIQRRRLYVEKVEEEERRSGVSTELTLFLDPWKIRKKLTSSDVSSMSRLLLQTEVVKAHILANLNEDQVRQVENKGLRFKVMDANTSTIHHLLLKKWQTSKSYVLIEGWNKDFVKRRGLKEGDEVGIFFDYFNSMFFFSVLH